MKKTIAILMSLVILNGCADELDRSNYLYCDMVSMWRIDTAAGVPMDDRRGWPDYDDRINCPNLRYR